MAAGLVTKKPLSEGQLFELERIMIQTISDVNRIACCDKIN
jgi:hypothetical protein